MNDALAAERYRRSTLLPPGAACEACGGVDPLLLDGDAARLLCADDAAIDQGREDTEEHHLARRGWNIVLDLTPNWHRVISSLQRMRRGVKYGAMAELLYGIADLIIAIADYVDRLKRKEPKRRGRSS